MKSEPKAKRSLKLVSNSQEAGPSAFYVNDSDDSLYDSSDNDADGDCCVCKKERSPGLCEALKRGEIVFNNWAQCDICDHWTHLRFCSSVRVVRKGTFFKCPHCEDVEKYCY